MEYKVIKDITEFWEVGAAIGDILTVGKYEGYRALFKDGKAVCDLGSQAEIECCKLLNLPPAQ